MMLDKSVQNTINGFEGSIAGLPLSDVIQLKGHNRFSGAISVEFRKRKGMIFFRDGDIIHAEQDGASGEDALYEILRWPGGRFAIQPKVTTTVRSIQQCVSYLLIEAHRIMDEENAGMRPKVAADGGEHRKMSVIAERLLQIAGVEYAVLLKKDGTPVEDESADAKALAAKGCCLSGLGNRLGDIFGLGGVKSAAVYAKGEQQLLFDAKNHYISISVEQESSLTQVESDIRASFGSRK